MTSVDPSAHEVALADGSSFDADAVIIGAGIVPNTQLAEEAGLKVENGIWVEVEHWANAAVDTRKPADPQVPLELLFAG